MSLSGSTPTYAANIATKSLLSVLTPTVLPLRSRVKRTRSFATSSTQPLWAAARITSGAPESINWMSVGVKETVMSTSPARRSSGGKRGVSFG